jgi:anti-sigma factor RsiW
MPSDLSAGAAALSCEVVAEHLPRIVDGSLAPDLGVVRHVDGCLRCQAELVQYRKLLKALHQLRTEVLEPAPGLLTDILASLEEAGERRAVRSLVRGRRAAYLGGLAAASVAAGAAGAIVLASRARSRRVRLAG